MLIRPKHPKPVRRKPAPPARTDEPVSRAPATAQRLLDLQEQAGNRAVTGLVTGANRSVQRSPVSAPIDETLYNAQNKTTGQATPGEFTNTPTTVANPDNASYDMTRAADDSGVTVLVKIRFLQQQRNSVAPPDPNPRNLPELGQLLDSPTEIPANDPTDRRTWATQTATAAANVWTGKHLAFASVTHPDPAAATTTGDAGAAPAGGAPAPAADAPIRLPVTFQAQAVFGLNDPAHQQIIVHPPSVIPGSSGQPIDSGNFYQQDPAHRSTNYSGTDDVIYAHEYGHLLGMPDEYSQSDEQLNAILHKAAPAQAASAQAALDRAALEDMAMAALFRPLISALQAAMPSLRAALLATQPLVTRKLADAARGGARDDAVRAELEAQLQAEAGPDQAENVPRIVAFETTKNFSNVGLADQTVSTAFAPAALLPLLRSAYNSTFYLKMHENVTIPDFDDVSVDVSQAVYKSTAGTDALGNAARAEAQGVAGRPGLPPTQPGAGVIGQLTGLPATWSSAGSLLETGVTPATFGALMASTLHSAAAAGTPAVATALGMPVRGHSSGALYQRAYGLVTNSSHAAATQLVRDLMRDTMQPTLATSAAAVQTAIEAEVNRVLSTPPTGHAAAGPSDPNMAAVVAAMKARLDADKATNAATPRQDPLAGGGTAADQNVTYTAQGLMGASNTTALRVDQFAPMVAAFNTAWRHAPREDPFTASVGGGGP